MNFIFNIIYSVYLLFGRFSPSSSSSRSSISRINCKLNNKNKYQSIQIDYFALFWFEIKEKMWINCIQNAIVIYRFFKIAKSNKKRETQTNVLVWPNYIANMWNCAIGFILWLFFAHSLFSFNRSIACIDVLF